MTRHPKSNKTNPNFAWFRLQIWQRPQRRMVFLGVLIFIAAVLSLLGYGIAYANRTLPHLYVAGFSVSGLSLPDAGTAIDNHLDDTIGSPLILKSGDATREIHAVDIGLIADDKATAAKVYAVGRQDQFLPSLADYMTQLWQRQTIPYEISYDADKLKQVVADFAATVDQPEVNAGVKVDNGKVIETAGASGFRLDQADLQQRIINHWTYGLTDPVVVERHEVKPVVASGDTAATIKQAEGLRGLKLTVHSDAKDLSPTSATFDSWIGAEVVGGRLQATLNQALVKQWLDKNAASVNQEVQEAKLSIQNGRASIFQVGQDGHKLDSDATATAVIKAVRDYVSQGSHDKTLVVPATFLVTKPTVTDQNITSLGITDLIGTATTSFVGSPDNRKHNISVGASTLNGILIKPGDEFSTLHYLGSIDGASGYLPELVIKEDKTTPEFGGGLCQVSTTLFRAALASGLKITERRNHKYRVSYYEPPVGMDATIYEGSPDLKFVNDTPNYILIQSRVEGIKISFDFYGTKDGRRVETTTPVVTDVVNPPDPLYTPTDTLPEGVTKRIESAHPGANASFVYTVYNSDGSVRNKQTFTSHYVPWQAKYLVGAAKPVEPSPSPSPTP